MALPRPIRVVMTKWGGGAHWEYDAILLGSDRHGDWLGVPTGTHFARPGRAFQAAEDQVVLAPRSESGGAGWWLATFHAAGARLATYVDMSTVPTWDDDVLSAVDLDLDVVRRGDDTIYVDDEDEFAEHSVDLAYPDQVTAAARSSCTWVLDAVRRRQPPFDGAHEPWLGQVRDLSAPR